MVARCIAVLGLLIVATSGARADRIDDLSRSLMQDPSYKVRVQAALILGKLADRRAVPALQQALRDENETVRGVAATSLGRIGDRASRPALTAALNDRSDFVRLQAKTALERLEGALVPHPNARFYVAVGFQSPGKLSEFHRVIRDALSRELGKLSLVTLSATGDSNGSQTGQHKREGYVVDGTIERLSSANAGGGVQVDCDVRAFVATYPGKAIKTMMTEGASLQTGSASAEIESAKRDCLAAVAESMRDDVNKFLQTVE